MSLFRPERLYVGLAPDRANLVRVGRQRQVLAARAVPLDFDPRAPQSVPLFGALASMRGKAGEISIVVADPLVRYFIVTVPQGLRSHAELQGAINAHFEEQFGLSSKDWEVRADLAPGCNSYLACAVPLALTQSLRAGCTDMRLRLLSIAPYTVSELNRWRRQLPARDFWFAAATTTSLTLGFRAKHGWRGMRTHRAMGEIQSQLPALLERDSLRLGVADVTILHYSGLVDQQAPHLPDQPQNSRTITRIGAKLWPGQGESWSREHRLALSGLWP